MTTSPNGMPTTIAGAATYYTRLGLYPIPLPHNSGKPGKRPVLPGWQALRPTEADVPRLFPGDGGGLNVGILLGEPADGLVDIDLDCREAIAVAEVLLPPTTWISGRAGAPRSHPWYQVAVPPATVRLCDPICDRGDARSVLVELRGTGAQTVVPPSLHIASGESIVWHCRDGDRPTTVDIGELTRAVHRVAAAALLARYWPRRGAKHDGRLALAGGLARAGWPVDDVETFVRAAASAAGDTDRGDCGTVARTTEARHEKGENYAGWPSLAKILTCGRQFVGDVIDAVRGWLGIQNESKSGYQTKANNTAAQRKPRPLRTYTPFPTHALPQPLRSFVREGAVAIGCDASYVALPVLTVAASLIGNARAIQLKRGWYEPSIIWTAFVGESGTLKTPPYKAALGPVYALQKRLKADYEAAVATHDQELADHNESKKKWKKAGSPEDDDPGPPPKKPKFHRVLTSDATIEKIGQMLADNPRGLLLGRDELDGWLKSFARYKGPAGGSDLPIWQEMYGATSVIIDRKTGDRPSIFIDRASVSVMGGIQPSTLKRAMNREFMGCGLAARLFLATPPKKVKKWTDAEIAHTTVAAYASLLDNLFGLGCAKDGGPMILRLTDEAKTEWVRFYDSWAREQAASNGDVAAAMSKLEGGAARLALIHHVVDRAARFESTTADVPLASIQAGIVLAKWFAEEAVHVYGLLAETDNEEAHRQLLSMIQVMGGRITVRQLMRSDCRKYPDAATADAALQVLVEAGLAKWVEILTNPNGRVGKALELVFRENTHDAHDTDDDAGEDDGPDGDSPHDTVPPHDTVGGACPDVDPDEFRPENRTEPYDIAADTADDGPTSSDGGASANDNGVIAVTLSSPKHEKTETAGQARQRCHAHHDDAHDAHDTVAPPTPYQLITDAALQVLAEAVEDSPLVGVDVETTGLDPRTDRVRLLSLTVRRDESTTFTYVVDIDAIPRDALTPIWEALAGVTVVAHHAAFDLSFLAPLGLVPGSVVDTMLMSQALYAGQLGQRHGLDDCVQRELDRKLDKALQKSDWTGTLTGAQLQYAAEDAAVLIDLHKALSARIHEAGLDDAVRIEHECLPGLTWLRQQGIPFDVVAWTALVQAAEDELEDLTRQLDAIAPTRPGHLPYHGSAWNWASPDQAAEVLTAVGCPVADTSDEALAAIEHPIADLLRRHRSANKRAATSTPLRVPAPEAGSSAMHKALYFKPFWLVSLGIAED